MKFGLIGYPIAHSLSPFLFKAGYQGRIPYELIEEEDFETAYARFMEEYDGVNVTAPFKELALKKADIISEECRLVSATNLLVKTPDGVTAYNSDYRGVLSILSGLRTDGCPRVLIVGTGGAGKAAAAAARNLGFTTILMNRTQHSDDILPLDSFREEFRKADIIIYNLPVRIPAIDLLSEEDFSPGQRKVLMEANYKDPSFDNGFRLKMAEANPLAEYIEGKRWLLMQAVTGYEIFTGERPDNEAMQSVIKSK